MAKKMLYAVYDSKVKFFHDPFLVRNRGEALRSWSEVANDQKSQISAHPTDFALMELGEYDDQDASIQLHSVPESLGLAVQFKKAPETSAPLFDLNQQQKVN